MRVFRSSLDETQRGTPEPKRWLYIPYDQLSAKMGPLAKAEPSELGLVFIESSWKAGRRPYHKQKLALVLANMRNFALEQARLGFAVRYVHSTKPYDVVLRRFSNLGTIDMMEPAERELRALLEPLVQDGSLRSLSHEGWLSERTDFLATQKPEGPWRMDRFYKELRKKTGLLMDGNKPIGGKFSFDTENRLPWKGEPAAPRPPRFTPNDVTIEVCELVEREFCNHPGNVVPEALPATLDDSRRLWNWAKDSCLLHFGPYEDAMSTQSSGLFHTRIAPLLNLHRLLPRIVVEEVVGLDIPLASKEGFVRQVLGWREFVRHVHRETDGFRTMPGGAKRSRSKTPGDGGYSRWAGSPWPAQDGGPDGGAKPNALGSKRSIPPAFWGTRSGLSCLDRVIEDVWSEAYSHHITRLMILSNLASLLDVEPRQVADWFWVAYSDAYDWVVEPNVLGMGVFATGELMITKPYVSGTPYIHKMSDYCGSCAFDPKKTCPISHLYWAYLDRHQSRLANVARLRVPLASLRKRDPAKRKRDQEIFEKVSRTLARGMVLSPEDMPG